MCLAVPGKILQIEGDDILSRMGVVDFDGVRRRVSLALTPEALEGQYVIVHAGAAISMLDEEAARQTLEYLRELAYHTDREDAPE